MKILTLALITALPAFSFAASKGALVAAIQTSTIPAIDSITEIGRDRCLGCFTFQITGFSSNQKMVQRVQTQLAGLTKYEAKILGPNE